VACDDGCLRLFKVSDTEDGAQYFRSFPKVAGRVLSVAWSASRDAIITGSSDGCLRVWCPDSGRELRRITASTGSDLCIWSVAILPHGEVVSGDSSGQVSVWDPQFGSLVQSLQQHCADVLRVAVSPDGSHIFASGIDNQVAAFRLVPAHGEEPSRWVYLDSKRPHAHDVRAMDIVCLPGDHEPLLVSGGNDAQLFCYSVLRFQKVHAVRLCKCPEKPAIQTGFAREAGQSVMISAQQDMVEIWSLGAALEKEGGKEGDFLDVADPPMHLARINASSHLTAVALSPDATIVAMSTSKKVSLCRVVIKDDVCRVEKLTPPKGLRPACHLKFSGDGAKLLCVGMDGLIQVVHVQEQKIAGVFDQVQVKDTGRAGTCLECCAAPVVSLTVDSDGKWGAIVCTRTVHLLAMNGDSSTYHGRVPAPKHISPITAAAFTPKGDRMIVSTAGNHIAMFQVETCLAVPYWHKDPSNELERRLESMPGSIVGMSFHPSPHEQRMIAYTTGGFCLVDFNKATRSPEASKTPLKQRRAQEWRERTATGGNGQRGENVRVVNLVEPCLYMGYVSSSAALLVELPWAEVLKKFPAPMYKHRFGT